MKTKFYYCIKIILFTPFWILSTGKTKKGWLEFKSGLIKHNCSYDYSKSNIDEFGKYYSCTHLGCNVISLQNQDESWCFDKWGRDIEIVKGFIDSIEASEGKIK
jgi:hypothetical protein